MNMISVPCFAPLLADLEEQLEIEAVHHQEAVSLRQKEEALFQQETSSSLKSSEDFPFELPDSTTLPPPEWPDSPPEDNIPLAEWVNGAHSQDTHVDLSQCLLTLNNADVCVVWTINSEALLHYSKGENSHNPYF